MAFTIFFYAVIYTAWLKRSTPQNIVIGGAAGALPPVVGWASITGTVSVEALILFACEQNQRFNRNCSGDAGPTHNRR